MTTVGINGITGRMGEAVREAAAERADVTVAFGLAPGDAALDLPVYDPPEASTALADHDPDVVVDFAVPESTVDLAEACAEAGVGLVVGTTGLDDAQSAVLEETSATVPLLKATNFSRGVQALLRTLGPALDALAGYDVEVMETHHNGKRDAPSGTAGSILEAIGEHREFETVPGREGIQPRDDDEIGVLVRRAGDIRGEHEVILAGNDEVLSLSHRAEDRGVFAAGALDAAVWLADRPPGRYEFGDVIDA